MQRKGIPARRPGRKRPGKIDTNPILPFTYDNCERTIPLDKNEPQGLFVPAPEARCDRRGNASSTPSNSSVPQPDRQGGCSVDTRRQKAHELADQAKITFKDGCYRVPSQSGGGAYTVILDERDAACDCPDFELRGGVGKPCKHILAARLWRDRQARGTRQATLPLPTPKAKRPTYPQNWEAYNAAQTNERTHFLDLLADLCRGIPEPPRTGRGRPPIPLADQAFAAVLKVYSLFSARRFMGDLEDAVERGHLRQKMHFNSVLNALDNPALTPVLGGLIERSSLPMQAVEMTFAPDSSGFCTSRFTRWFDVKYGVTREEAEWVKVHLICGTKTNIVTAAVILDKNANDSPQLPGLVNATAKNFTVKEVPADKGYLSVENVEAVAKVGGVAFIPAKTSTTGAAGGLFEKMYYYFLCRREEFLGHYHTRSNVEATFSAIKRKFGDSVRSKGDVAMRSEVLCKIVAHNICVCIAEWYALGIEPVFATGAGCTNNAASAHIIPFRTAEMCKAGTRQQRQHRQQQGRHHGSLGRRSGTNRTGATSRVFRPPSAVLVITWSVCSPGVGPTGITILPPGLSCLNSGSGAWSAPQVTTTASNGAASAQPLYPSPARARTFL